MPHSVMQCALHAVTTPKTKAVRLAIALKAHVIAAGIICTACMGSFGALSLRQPIWQLLRLFRAETLLFVTPEMLFPAGHH